ncbi:hypothetical protein, partial [Streptomyces alkaliphilus]|uniref:hypothetical protein n=1 Tax=Streptomyces alkaliphilus TaxID=1472722 RepID=UPI001E38D406
MGWTVLYIAFGLVALWLLGEVLLQYKARLRWRLLAFFGFLGVVFGVLLPSVPVITLGALAFATGQTLVTLSYRKGFSTGWALGGNPGTSPRRREVRPMEPLPDGPAGAAEPTGADEGHPPRGGGRHEPAPLGGGPGRDERDTAGVLGGWGETPGEPHRDPLARPYGQEDTHAYADWSDPGAGAAGTTGSGAVGDDRDGWETTATGRPVGVGYGGADWSGSDSGAPGTGPDSYGMGDPYETGGWSTVGYGGITDTGAQPVADWGVAPGTPAGGWGPEPTPAESGQGPESTFAGGWSGVTETGSQDYGYGYPVTEPGYPGAQSAPPPGAPWS